MNIYNRTEKELLFSVKAMIILFNSGLGLETVIHHISNEKYGQISSGFRKVLTYIKDGNSTEDALEKLKEKTRSTNFRRVIEALEMSDKENIDIVKKLENISKHILDKKKIEIKNFIDRMNVIMTVFTLILLVPVLAQTFKLMEAITSATPFSIPIISDTVYISIFVADIILLLALIPIIKVMEPVI